MEQELRALDDILRSNADRIESIGNRLDAQRVALDVAATRAFDEGTEAMQMVKAVQNDLRSFADGTSYMIYRARDQAERKYPADDPIAWRHRLLQDYQNVADAKEKERNLLNSRYEKITGDLINVQRAHERATIERNLGIVTVSEYKNAAGKLNDLERDLEDAKTFSSWQREESRRLELDWNASREQLANMENGLRQWSVLGHYVWNIQYDGVVFSSDGKSILIDKQPSADWVLNEEQEDAVHGLHVKVQRAMEEELKELGGVDVTRQMRSQLAYDTRAPGGFRARRVQFVREMLMYNQSMSMMRSRIKSFNEQMQKQYSDSEGSKAHVNEINNEIRQGKRFVANLLEVMRNAKRRSDAAVAAVAGL